MYHECFNSNPAQQSEMVLFYSLSLEYRTGMETYISELLLVGHGQ